jgi:hypothetical protein
MKFGMAPTLAVLLGVVPAALTATKDAGGPDKEMLRMMEFLKEMEMLKQLDMLQELQRVDVLDDPATGAKSSKAVPLQKKGAPK